MMAFYLFHISSWLRLQVKASLLKSALRTRKIFILNLFNRNPAVEECDATMFNSSTKAGYQKIRNEK